MSEATFRPAPPVPTETPWPVPERAPLAVPRAGRLGLAEAAELVAGWDLDGAFHPSWDLRIAEAQRGAGLGPAAVR